MNDLTGYATVFFVTHPRPGRITKTHFGNPVSGLHTLADVKQRLVERFPGATFLAAEFTETDHQMNTLRRFEWWPGGLREIASS